MVGRAEAVSPVTGFRGAGADEFSLQLTQSGPGPGPEDAGSGLFSSRRRLVLH
jgi:hypothetical protein